MKKPLLLYFLLSFLPFAALSQTPVALSDKVDQHRFFFNEIASLEDKNGDLSFADIRKADADGRFAVNKAIFPLNTNRESFYWYKIVIHHNPSTKKNWILEFFDQTIHDITAYVPDQNGQYLVKRVGGKYPFESRYYHHKNFELDINHALQGPQTYYFRIKSPESASIIIVMRSVNWFISYALDEYFLFGMFYGMILIFSLYNLMMFMALRQSQYIYYILYILSVGLYEISADGVAYHYLWPDSVEWNRVAPSISLYLIGLFGLLFTVKLLYVKSKAPRLYKLILWVIALRTIFLFLCLFVNRNWFSFKFVEAILLLLGFYTGYHIWKRGYRPARFYVLGYSFLTVGFFIKLLILIDPNWVPFGPITHYSLSLCFVLEMTFFSFAIGDKMRLLKKKRDIVHRKVIEEHELNNKLKDTLNKNLEQQVMERTKEVFEKSTIIEAQNSKLMAVNDLLQKQAEEISRMNILLEQDNIALQQDVQKVTKARIMSADVDFEEFSKIYPDSDSCYSFLANLKWKDGYECRKCNNKSYISGHIMFSRRCSKCGYEESVTTNTIFHNSRIPITKAFYMIFLIYSTKGKISSHKLSEILSIRQSTCWAYSSKIKKTLKEKRREISNAHEEGWSKIVLEEH